jgi:hypothetical protein
MFGKRALRSNRLSTTSNGQTRYKRLSLPSVARYKGRHDRRTTTTTIGLRSTYSNKLSAEWRLQWGPASSTLWLHGTSLRACLGEEQAVPAVFPAATRRGRTTANYRPEHMLEGAPQINKPHQVIGLPEDFQWQVKTVLEQLQESLIVGSGVECIVSQELLWHADSSGPTNGNVCRWKPALEEWLRDKWLGRLSACYSELQNVWTGDSARTYFYLRIVKDQWIQLQFQNPTSIVTVPNVTLSLSLSLYIYI